MAQNDCPYASVEGNIVVCDRTGESCKFEHPNKNCNLAKNLKQEIKRRKERFH